jgi:hypothetical protein
MTKYLILAMLLASCSAPTPEQMARKQLYELEQTCLRKHGSPVVEGGEFKKCEYSASFHFRKTKE